MGSAYLSSTEIAAFGLPSSTTAADVASASALVDAHLKRPEGLGWSPDADGQPCYMSALSPTLTLVSSVGVAAGSNVTVAISSGFISPDLVGEILILDRADPSLTEACEVMAVGQGTITLLSVRRTHAGGVKLESGLVILEERGMPQNRSIARVSRWPVARILSARGRYAYGRRSQQQAGVFAEPSILAAVQVFGGPPAWNWIDVAHVSASSATGEVWIPAGALNAAFSDVRLRYVAGFPSTAIPDAVKSATAAVVAGFQAAPELQGGIKAIQAGGSRIEKFADTLLDANTRATLDTFAARLLY